MVRGRGSPALPDIRAAHQIVQTDIKEVSDGDQAVEVGKALGILIALLGAKGQTKLFGHLPLLQTSFFSQ